MKTTKLLLGAMIVSASAVSLPSFAEVYIQVAPPAPRVERFEPRVGYVVVPGSWNYNHGQYVWAPGRYVAERKDYRYQNDRWVQHDNKKWQYQRGGWSQDRDHDGTPDRNDRAPNNPNRQ